MHWRLSALGNLQSSVPVLALARSLPYSACFVLYPLPFGFHVRAGNRWDSKSEDIGIRVLAWSSQRMHQVRTIAIDDPCVCQSVTRTKAQYHMVVDLKVGHLSLELAKTAERIDVLFRVETLGNPSNIVLDCKESCSM